MKPSDHVLHGECPFCHGRKTVTFDVPVEHTEDCPLCEGTGAWPPPNDHPPVLGKPDDN